MSYNDTRHIMQTYIRERRYSWPIQKVQLQRRYYHPKAKNSYTLQLLCGSHMIELCIS